MTTGLEHLPEMDAAIRSITRPMVATRTPPAPIAVDADQAEDVARVQFELAFSNLPTGFLRAIRRAAERYGCEPLWTAVEDAHDACTGG